jgi:hypothetical protein
VCAARLLAEGERDAEQQGAGERRPRASRLRFPPGEVERHQREAHRGVRAGKAGGARQVVRAILEQVDVGSRAAESGEVARAVHVRREFEEVDDGRAEGECERDEAGGTPPGPQRRDPVTADEHEQGAEADGAHERRSGAVDQGLGPPRAGPDPRRGARVEEKREGDAPVEVERVNERGRGQEEGRRHPQLRQPDVRRAGPARRRPEVAGHQKLRFVWMRNCTLSIDGSPSSGKARSKWMTLPSAERVLPRRSPNPTSFRSPRSALGSNGASP